MKRSLIKQMRNEWRDNIWLVLGLAIVCLAVWVISVDVVSQAKNTFIPLGAEVDNVFRLDIDELPEESPDYEVREKNRRLKNSRDMLAIITRIRQSPYVEAAAFSQNALPYSYSYYGSSLALEPGDTIRYMCNFRYASPDIVRVLKIKSLTGKSGEALEEMLRSGKVLISNVLKNYGNKTTRKPEELNGKKVYESEEEYVAADIVEIIRRSDYEVSSGGMVLKPIDEEGRFDAYNIAVRIKPGTAGKFREEFENSPEMQRHGNMMASNLTEMKDVASNLMRSESVKLRMRIGLMVSLVIIVALGLLGVFWFRIQQRVSEIAIRKVAGATMGDVFRRVLAEGMLMLLLAVVLASAVGWPIVNSMTEGKDSVTLTDKIVAEAITVAVMAIGITVSIMWPAWRATRVEPAIAIKEE